MKILIDLHFYLHLIRADVELAEDIAEEVLDLVPGVDTVGAIQYDHNVHVCGAPCHVWGFKNIWLTKPGLCSIFLCLIYVCVQMCGYFALLERWSLLVLDHH